MLDIIDAWHGYARANGIDETEKEFMSKDELNELMQKFPDTKDE